MVEMEALRVGIRRSAMGLPCAWLVVLAELAVVALARRDQLASVWELQFGSLWLMPTAFALAVPPALVGGLLLASLERPTQSWRRAWIGVATAGAVMVALGVSTGRHFEAWPARAGFVGVVAVALNFLGHLEASSE
jgi:hypothetical protein